MAKVATDKMEMEEEAEAKLSDAVPDKAQRAAKEKELTGLRRQRGLRKAAVTRIRKTLEEEISAQATRDTIEEMNMPLKDAFADWRKAHRLYENLIEEEEIEDTKEYADRLEEEESVIRRKVQQYLQKLEEARSSVATSRRSFTRAKSRGSAMSAVSVRSREAAVELEDADQKLRDVKAQLTEGRSNTKDRLRSEMDQLETEKPQRQEQIESEMRQRQEQMETEMRQRQEQIEMEKCRQQKQREMEERDRALQLKVAEEARSRAARKVHLYRAAESELNWDRRHDFEDPAAIATERPRSTERGACGVGGNAAEARDNPAQEKTHNVSQEYLADASTKMPEPFVCEEDQGEQLPAGDMTKNAAKPRREMPRDGGTPLNPSTWTSSNTERRESHSPKPSTFAKSIPRLSLPRFAGASGEWPSWIGLFRALVHDQSALSDTERMTHLQQAVEGAAHQAIKGFLFDGNMYHQALAALYERFGQEGDVSQAYLNSMFTTPTPSVDDVASMERFSSAINNAVMTLRTLGYCGDLDASENLRRVVSKLPAELLFQWGREVHKKQPNRPNLEVFSEWLKTEVSILRHSAAQSRVTEKKRPKETHPKEDATRRTTLTASVTRSREARRPSSCLICKNEHRLQDCPEYKAKTHEERLVVVRTERLCWACLRKGHFMRVCRSARRCGLNGCQATHHRLLHEDKSYSTSRRESGAEAPNQSQEEGPIVGVALTESTDTLLQLVPVRIHGPKGERDVVALLGSGAQTSLCCKDVLEELGIHGREEDLRLQNVEGSGATQSSFRVQLTVSPLSADAKKGRIVVPEVWSVPKLNVAAPRVSNRKVHSWKHLQDLDLRQYSGAQVELLLGANILEAVVQREARVGGPGQPVAVRTKALNTR